MPYIFTITEAHIKAKPLLGVPAQEWRYDKTRVEAAKAKHVLGVLLPQDVGKRVFKVGSAYQVENEGQRQARLQTGRMTQ